MDSLVTVNSSVGFEAMLLDKVVTTMGKNPYNISGALPSFQDLVKSNIDREAYRQVTGKIANIMLNYYLYPIEILHDFNILSRAIKRGIALTDEYRRFGFAGMQKFVRNNPINLVRTN